MMLAAVEQVVVALLSLLKSISPRFERSLLTHVRAFVRAESIRFLKKQGLMERIETYVRGSETTGCSYGDYAALYSYVRRTKPQEILECGTGVSTVIMAHALAENERETGIRGRITSMEELPEYYEMAKGLLPQDLAPYIDLVLSDTEEYRYGVFRGMKYRNTPKRTYDFVFVDGPGTRSIEHGDYTFDADVISLARTQQGPLDVMVDGRSSTCTALFVLFGGDRFSFDYIRGTGMLRMLAPADLSEDRLVGSKLVQQRTFNFASARTF